MPPSASPPFGRSASPRTVGTFLAMGLLVGTLSPLRAQTVTVNPPEAIGPLRNPLMGFRPDLGNRTKNPYATVVRHYIK